MNEIYEFLKNAGTFYLATVNGNEPEVRPFGAVCVFEGKLYIITNNKKEVYKQMKENSCIAISGMYKGKWIRVKGEVEEDTRREARVAMMEANPSLSSMYNVDDNIMTVFKFVTGSGTICSFTEDPVTYSL